MNFALIELILWAGLFFFFWVLKDNLGRVESVIDDIMAGKNYHAERPGALAAYVRPEKRMEPIGNYLDEQIYEYVIIDGRSYRFDHVVPSGVPVVAAEGECCIAPGLVYVACSDRAFETC